MFSDNEQAVELHCDVKPSNMLLNEAWETDIGESDGGGSLCAMLADVGRTPCNPEMRLHPP